MQYSISNLADVIQKSPAVSHLPGTQDQTLDKGKKYSITTYQSVRENDLGWQDAQFATPVALGSYQWLVDVSSWYSYRGVQLASLTRGKVGSEKSGLQHLDKITNWCLFFSRWQSSHFSREMYFTLYWSIINNFHSLWLTKMCLGVCLQSDTDIH